MADRDLQERAGLEHTTGEQHAGEEGDTKYDDRGMTTAEYAVGTVAAATLAGVLIKVVSDTEVFELILKIILWILAQFTGFTG